ncbi:hypothetical protein BDFB_003819 [Asbolus verrucosus]|uniref:Uncharacterized protein n=1 Tax=Asbolus verrucosus TaxID=1661398 RepID=A0A482VMD2_ASBVE|nr:hypothetical protein BDFB_003819 [Asbolus verrucosus]
MNKPRPCGCKGCRTCLICEKNYGITSKNVDLEKENSYVYCPHCDKAWPGWDPDEYKKHPKHDGEPLEYPGVHVKLEFLTPEEEHKLMEGIDRRPWSPSQSGRRKQNMGPKCNFKKNKIREGAFDGFPKFSKFVQDKFGETPILKDFTTIEQCFLEYSPERGASIDPHIDDCWIWGERIVTVNLLSDSVLTMTYNRKSNYYNLDHVGTYPSVLDPTRECYRIKPYKPETNYPIVRIPMPNRSLLVLYNSARYDWEHQVLREDVRERRVCIAYREFTPPYLQNGVKHDEGEKILIKAQQYWD